MARNWIEDDWLVSLVLNEFYDRFQSRIEQLVRVAREEAKKEFTEKESTVSSSADVAIDEFIAKATQKQLFKLY